jgi:hypothetical protein
MSEAGNISSQTTIYMGYTILTFIQPSESETCLRRLSACQLWSNLGSALPVILGKYLSYNTKSDQMMIKYMRRYANLTLFSLILSHCPGLVRVIIASEEKQSTR